jgi:hypothetical protein
MLPMQSDARQTDIRCKPSLNNTAPEDSLYRVILRNSVWLLGILTWLFGVFDRVYAIVIGEMFTLANFAQLLTVVALFGGWLYLKPEDGTHNSDSVAFQDHTASPDWQQSHYVGTAQARMSELHHYHLVGQEYVLPFPYLCQIYHLLNLKHLETVHNFSLNNLKILHVKHFQPTAIGGKLQFQTVLESPLNILRFWRQAIVEVELTLHTPFTVELQIPVRDRKFINVIFNVLPLTQGEHKFFVDIYSDLPWPKPFLRFLLQFATSLTLLEDLPYLRQLAALKQHNLMRSSHPADSIQGTHHMMQLFYRYVDLYSALSCLEPVGKLLPDNSSQSAVT